MTYLKLAVIVAVLAAATVTGYKLGAGRWEGKYQALVAEDWKARAVGESLARKHVEAQLAKTREVSENNAEVLRDLQDQTASVVADRDRARKLADRLLHRSQSCPAGSGVPEAHHQPGTSDAGEAAGTDRLRDLLVAARTEALGNADTLDALISQLQPQLGGP